jgi:hypothetical protein
VIGDHGTSQVFLWSSARIAGVPVTALLKERGEKLDDVRTQLESDVRYANITIIEGHDASQYGIGIVSARIAEMVLRDERAAIPIGSYQRDLGVTLSLPSVVGRDGVVEVLQPDLAPEERNALQRSAQTVKNALKRSGNRQSTIYSEFAFTWPKQWRTNMHLALPVRKLEELTRTLTSATDVDLKDLAATRRGLVLATLLAALPATLLVDRAEAIDPAQTQVTVPDQYRWKPGLAGAPAQSVETVPLFGATDKPGLYVVLVKWRPGAAHLRDRPTVLCHLRHLVGEFGREF